MKLAGSKKQRQKNDEMMLKIRDRIKNPDTPPDEKKRLQQILDESLEDRRKQEIDVEDIEEGTAPRQMLAGKKKRTGSTKTG